jgi:hypothetical protein
MNFDRSGPATDTSCLAVVTLSLFRTLPDAPNKKGAIRPLAEPHRPFSLLKRN